MFAYIKGVVEEMTADTIVLDHDGIGYLIYVPSTVLSQLPGKGVEVKIHTYFQVKEDGFSLQDRHQVRRLVSALLRRRLRHGLRAEDRVRPRGGRSA